MYVYTIFSLQRFLTLSTLGTVHFVCKSTRIFKDVRFLSNESHNKKR